MDRSEATGRGCLTHCLPGGVHFYTSPFTQTKYPRPQIRTVRELLQGKGVDYPAREGANVTFRRAHCLLLVEAPRKILGKIPFELVQAPVDFLPIRHLDD